MSARCGATWSKSRLIACQTRQTEHHRSVPRPLVGEVKRNAVRRREPHSEMPPPAPAPRSGPPSHALGPRAAGPQARPPGSPTPSGTRNAPPRPRPSRSTTRTAPRPRATPRCRAHKVVDPRIRLEHAHLLDRQDRIDRRPDPGRGHRRLQHRGRPVRQDRHPPPRAPSARPASPALPDRLPTPGKAPAAAPAARHPPALPPPSPSRAPSCVTCQKSA